MELHIESSGMVEDRLFINDEHGITVAKVHVVDREAAPVITNIVNAHAELLAACEAGSNELIGLRAYLTTCDFGVIRENIDGLAYKMNDVRVKIEAAIRKAKGE